MRVRSFLARAVPLAALAMVVACGDDPTSARPVPAKPVSILDDGSTGGNSNFFFLPPIALNPSRHPAYSPGRFNGTWSPTVSVCPVSLSNLDAGCTGAPVRTYTGAAVTVSLADEHYQVHIDTKEAWAIGGQTYRFTTLLPGGIVLGFVDITLLSTSAKNARTGTTVELQDGRNIPLKFRIEKPDAAIATEALVSQAGGIVRANGTGGPGSFAIQFAPNFIPAELGVTQVLVTVERLNTTELNPCYDPAVAGSLLKTGDCWRVETYPSLPRLAADVIVAFCPGIAPGNAGYEQQSMYKFDAPSFFRELENVTTSLVTCTPGEGTIGALPDDLLGKLQWGATHVARGFGKVFGPSTAYALDAGYGGRLSATEEAVEEGSVFSEFFWAVEAELHVEDGATSPPAVGLPREVVVQMHGDHHDEEEAVAGITITAGSIVNAIVSPSSAVTNSDGNAIFTVTPIAAGPLSVTFSGAIGSGISIVYSATAGATPVVSILRGATNIAGTTQDITQGFPQIVQVTAGSPALGCTLVASTPTIVNTDNITGGFIVVGNAPGTATVTGICGSASSTVTYVVDQIDSIRVVFGTGITPIGAADEAIIASGFTSTFAAIPYEDGAPIPAASCSFSLVNPPSTAAFVGQGATTAWLVDLTGIAPSGTLRATLGITCYGVTRNIAVGVVPPIG